MGSWIHAARSQARASETEGNGLPGRAEKGKQLGEVVAGVRSESSEATDVWSVLPWEPARAAR